MDAKTLKSLLLPWKLKLLFSIGSPALDVIMRKDGTVNRHLLRVADVLKKTANSEPIEGVKTYDVVVDQTRELWFRVFVPTQHASEDLTVMVFFHGGGYIILSPDVYVYDGVCRRFSRELNVIVVSVNYRLAPEHRHPAQYYDGFDVLKFLDSEEHRSKWLPKNANISRCFVAGDSAGGNLAHHVTRRASEYSFQKLKVIKLMVIQPFSGGEERTNSEIELDGIAPVLSLKLTDWFWNAFMPLGDNRDHPFINVSGPNAVDISKTDFPATMVVVAGFDILRDWQLRYFKWLKKSRKEAYLVDYPNTFHTFFVFPELPESDQHILEMKDFISKV